MVDLTAALVQCHTLDQTVTRQGLAACPRLLKPWPPWSYNLEASEARASRPAFCQAVDLKHPACPGMSVPPSCPRSQKAASACWRALQPILRTTSPPPRFAGISGASYYEGSFSTINRSPAGDYVAVSSRGNFYMTWTPGQAFWQPHNRPRCSFLGGLLAPACTPGADGLRFCVPAVLLARVAVGGDR